MRRRRGAALVAVVGACVALVSGAGAATHPGVRAQAAQFDFSTHKGVVRYLASVGLHSRGFVIQRGHRNYAGPSCPGKGWTCTRSTRVVQVTTRQGDVNRYEYSAPAAPGSPCGTVQSGPSNNAKAIITAGTTQSCTITQNATGSGGNFAQLSETIVGSGASQTASQDAQVTQTSVTGSNSVQITQKVTQSISENLTEVTESQVSDQTFTVKQNVTQSTATVGTNSSKVDQTLTQTETATSAVSGSQYQRANLIGHVDQFSHALSTSQNNQTESQSETAVANSSVSQTQIGPTRCCTSQGDNARDTFKVVQKTKQTNNSANRSYTEDAQIDLSTTGSASGSQTITQNGNTTTNSSTGSTVNLGTTCTQGTCTPAQTGFPSGNVFVSIGDGNVQEWNVSGSPTLVTTLNTGYGPGTFTTGLAFDAAGNLYVTDFNANDVSKFNGSGVLVGPFGGGYDADPESILFDASGNAYVGQADGTGDVLKFGPSGNAVASFDVATEDRGSDHIALAPDGCTLFYTSEGTSVKRFNVCTNTQLTDFAIELPDTAFAVKLLPGGGALVADSSSIKRLDALGTIVQQYGSPASGAWFSLALDPGGTSFWAGDSVSGDVKQFDLTSGAVLASFNTGVSQPEAADGLAVAP
jgi:hypothetical protein